VVVWDDSALGQSSAEVPIRYHHQVISAQDGAALQEVLPGNSFALLINGHRLAAGSPPATFSVHRNDGLALTPTKPLPPPLSHCSQGSEASSDVFQAKASALFFLGKGMRSTEQPTRRNQCFRETE